MKTIHRPIRLGMVSSRVNVLDPQEGAHLVEESGDDISPLIRDQDLIRSMSG
jgi:hypothetical protein